MKFEYKNPQPLAPIAHPTKYRSYLSLYAFDCDAGTTGQISTTFYSQPNGGEVVASTEPAYVPMSYPAPRTIDAVLLSAVCAPPT